jgi:prophage maintenance system killer protein
MKKIKKLISLPRVLVKRIKVEAKSAGISDSGMVQSALEHWFDEMRGAGK